MANTPLIERMKKKDAPKAWVNEVRALLRTIEAKDATIEEYLGVIDSLARKVEALEANTSKSVLRRIEYQLKD